MLPKFLLYEDGVTQAYLLMHMAQIQSYLKSINGVNFKHEHRS